MNPASGNAGEGYFSIAVVRVLRLHCQAIDFMNQFRPKKFSGKFLNDRNKDKARNTGTIGITDNLNPILVFSRVFSANGRSIAPKSHRN
jgi:hypothetical protein